MSVYTPQATVAPAATRLHTIPVPQLRGNVAGSFAQQTIQERLPVTLRGAMEDVQLTMEQPTTTQAAIKVGAAICSGIQLLAMEMEADAPLFPLSEDTVELADSLWNPVLQGHTWLDAPWLTAECYMYRRLQRLFDTTPADSWQGYDVFARRKHASFDVARSGIQAAAQALEALLHKGPRGPLAFAGPTTAPEECAASAAHKDGFAQVLHNALWGNQADLSLHVAFDGTGVRALEGSRSSNGGIPDILVDDTATLWQQTVRFLRQARVDVVLDNAGLELFMDLCMADWLVHHGYAGTVVLHVKQMPWFVSDATASDVAWIVNAVGAAGVELQCEAMQALATRWQRHLQSGRWAVASHAFWTCPLPYWDMPACAPELFAELARNSALLVFKGDLNYRRLVGDGLWAVQRASMALHLPPTTQPEAPITEATCELLQPHWGDLRLPPTVALRTCKSDTIAGLPAGLAARVVEWERAQGRSAEGWEWMTDGRYAMVQLIGGQH